MLNLAKFLWSSKNFQSLGKFLTKKKKHATGKRLFNELKIQRLKLEILPYYPDGDFNAIKEKF